LTGTARNEETPPAASADLEQRAAGSARQLEALARELDAFGSTLSHDLRAPLRSIEGFSRILLQPPYDAQIDATGRDYLQRIHGSSLRLTQMMEDLLEIVRLARYGAKAERVDLTALAHDVLARLRAAAPARRIEIEVQPDISVTGDPALLRLVLENLLGNACKFSAGKQVAHIFFGRATEEGVAALCVRDNGAGFEQKYAGKLFHAFQRLHSATEFEGTGVGLAKTQRAIHAHGGRIWGQGERGAGAAFYFTLPGPGAAAEG